VAGVADSEIVHIPHVLYHWRAVHGSTALAADEKDYTTAAGIKALENYARISNIDAEISKGYLANTYRVAYPIPDPEPLVSLIIPTRDQFEMLSRCISSIIEKTSYPNYEIVILDNQSEEKGTIDYFQTVEKEEAVRVFHYDHPFNFSAINNYGVGKAKGDIIGFVNNDIEVISPNWLTEMVSHATRQKVGCVGAKLYYPDERIQHAGVILGIGGVAGHSHKYVHKSNPGYFSRLLLVQNLSAVTAACMVVRKSVFDQVGGFNESDLAVAFNDVDLCLRVKKAGYRNLWTPYAELFHHESVSRGSEDSPEKIERFKRETAYMKEQWGRALVDDPCYSPNLTLVTEDFSLA
jgi:GT2 family glycosyltransferase